jgi:hypothetical protein
MSRISHRLDNELIECGYITTVLALMSVQSRTLFERVPPGTGPYCSQYMSSRPCANRRQLTALTYHVFILAAGHARTKRGEMNPKGTNSLVQTVHLPQLTLLPKGEG